MIGITAEMGVHKGVKGTTSTTSTKTYRDSEASVRTVKTEVGRFKWILIGGMSKIISCEIT